MRILILAFACASTLSGCAALTAAPWPTEGTGGFAELLPIDDDRIEALRDRVESFRERGAATAAAAEFASADLLLVRVRREVAAGLLIDADSDVTELERVFAKIDKALQGSKRAHGGRARS